MTGITIEFKRNYFEYEDKIGDDKLIICYDHRHGKPGYIVSRFLLEKDDNEDGGVVWNWDERYQFYVHLDEVFVAFLAKDYDQGRKDF